MENKPFGVKIIDNELFICTSHFDEFGEQIWTQHSISVEKAKEIILDLYKALLDLNF